MDNCLIFNGSTYGLHPIVASFRKSYLIQFKSKNYKSNCDGCVSLSSFPKSLLENALIYIEEILSQYALKWVVGALPTLVYNFVAFSSTKWCGIFHIPSIAMGQVAFNKIMVNIIRWDLAF